MNLMPASFYEIELLCQSCFAFLHLVYTSTMQLSLQFLPILHLLFCSSFHNSNFISISFHYRYAEINFRSSNSQTGKREHLLYRYTRTSIHFSIPFFVSLFAFYVNFIHFSIMFFVLENDFTTQFTLGVSFFLRSHFALRASQLLEAFFANNN